MNIQSDDNIEQENTDPVRVVIVTGPSGAGRTTAIHALEDIGYETIDNLPLTFLPRLLEGPPLQRHLALGVDIRNRDFSGQTLIDLVKIIQQEEGFECSLLYLDCSEEVLLRRFSETRRRHPLSVGQSPHSGIELEQSFLTSLRERADYLLDTSDLTAIELRGALADWFAFGDSPKLSVSIQSFSFKRGMPAGYDTVFDCRFLRNPHWNDELRQLDGRSADVAAYVAEDPRFADFFKKICELLEMLIPAYREEGKYHFTVGLGCTGGQHRSVFVAEAVGKALAQTDAQVSIRHRELERREVFAPPPG